MLTRTQALIIFSILAAPGAGALQKDVCPSIAKPDREALVKAGLISVTKRGSGLWLEATDKGWHWAQTHLDAELPESAAILHAWLTRLKIYLAAENLVLADILAPRSENAAPDVRAAYLALTQGRLNQRVRLADLRTSICDRAALDAALGQAHGREGLQLSGSDNPPELTAADRAAALVYKGEPMHFVWITR